MNRVGSLFCQSCSIHTLEDSVQPAFFSCLCCLSPALNSAAPLHVKLCVFIAVNFVPSHQQCSAHYLSLAILSIVDTSSQFSMHTFRLYVQKVFNYHISAEFITFQPPAVPPNPPAVDSSFYPHRFYVYLSVISCTPFPPRYSTLFTTNSDRSR